MTAYAPGTLLAVADEAIHTGTMSREKRLACIAVARRIARPGNAAEALLEMHETRLAVEDAERRTNA